MTGGGVLLLCKARACSAQQLQEGAQSKRRLVHVLFQGLQENSELDRTASLEPHPVADCEIFPVFLCLY